MWWIPMTAKRITGLPACRGGSGWWGSALQSLNREDAGHAVEGRDIRHETLDLQLAAEELERDSSPNVVVVHRHAEEPDREVAQAHDRLGLRADRDRAPGLEAVVNTQPAAVEHEGHAVVDVGDPDANSRHQRVKVLLLSWIGQNVGFDQATEHLREGAGFLARILDQPSPLWCGLYFSSGHSTGIRVVHSVISCDAFV